MNLDELKYPIGKFKKPTNFDSVQVRQWIQEISNFPRQLGEVVNRFEEHQLEMPYRPEGWTARQVIHHIGDSHMNSVIRFKLALTETNPTIRPYDENGWSQLPDYQLSIESSLLLIRALHERWVHLLSSLTNESFEKTFLHPGNGQTWNLYQNTALYAWHGQHHLGHLKIIAAKS